MVDRLDKSVEALIAPLTARIALRAALLKATDFEGIVDSSRVTLWKDCQAGLPLLKKTHELGKPIPGCFSRKLQRKLASTVPPRPILEVKFADAFDILSRLCQDAENAYGILPYHGAVNLQVQPKILGKVSAI